MIQSTALYTNIVCTYTRNVRESLMPDLQWKFYLSSRITSYMYSTFAKESKQLLQAASARDTRSNELSMRTRK